uniref:Mobilization protein n=1 Tax=Panagrolaimus sp. JU765 TaxID=591449 RepID=A0AC34R5D7_9BILA
MAIGDHVHEKHSQVEYAQHRFKERLEGLLQEQKLLSASNMIQNAISTFEHSELMLKYYHQGWCLDKGKKTVIRFTEEQKNFLEGLFEKGLKEKGNTVRTEIAEQKMKDAKDNNGNPMFKPTECLSKQQIKSFFGTLARKYKQRSMQRDLQVNELRYTVTANAQSLGGE